MRAPGWGALLSVAGCASPTQRAPEPGGAQPVEVRFEGNETFSDSALREEIEEELDEFARRAFAKAVIDDAAFALETFYAREGFPFARIEYALEARAQESPRVRFRIEEGPRTFLEELRFEGNESFSAEELRALLESRRRGLSGAGDRYFVRGAIDEASQAIEGHYVDRGFLDVSIGEPRVEFREERRRASVTIPIREGPRYRVASVRVEGELALTEGEALEAAGVPVGEAYVPRVGYEGRARLLEFFGDRGYPDASVELEERIDPGPGSASLVYRIVAGPRVTVSEVRVEGNEPTSLSFIEARTGILAGEIYSAKRVRESFRALFRTGLFESVDLGLEGEGTERALVVRVKESPSIETFVEPGWGSYELARIRAGVREKNLLGTGRSLRAEVTGAVRAQEALVGVTDPWFLGTELRADFPIFFKRREEPSFTRLEWGGRALFHRSWTKGLDTTLGYELYRSEAKDVEVVDPTAPPSLDEVSISAVSLAAGLDSRDDVFVPRKGFSTTGSVEWGDGAIGSELDFLRAKFAQSAFVPLSDSTVVGGSFRAGAIFPLHDTAEIPIQERFFNGGESTVRSFRQDELGPKDVGGDPLGGEGYTVLSFEFRQGIVDRLEAAAFYDTGNVSTEASDTLKFEDLRSGIGAGLRYLLPIGPVRLDAAWNPNPRDEEDRFVLHFSVGMAF
jgi:outer membrane protein assembly complex protein YaeT